MTAEKIQMAVFFGAIAAGMLAVIIAGLRDRAKGVKSLDGRFTMALIVGGLSGCAALIACLVLRMLLSLVWPALGWR
jgi:hypothetical protein